MTTDWDGFDTEPDSVEHLSESLAGVLQERGWYPILHDRGMALSEIQSVCQGLRLMAKQHPLHARGSQLRHSYIFGRGMRVDGLSKKQQAIYDDPANQATLFSVNATVTLNMEKFCTGNVIVVRDTVLDTFTIVPLEEISDLRCDSFDGSRVMYIKRTWSVGEEPSQSIWIPTAWVTRNRKRLPGRIAGDSAPVKRRYVAYVSSSQRHAGWAWGVPDSLAGAIYSRAYSEYLQNSSSLSKALSMIAWSVTSKARGGAKDTAAKVHAAQQTGSVGGTAVNNGTSQIAGVGVPSAQVNYNNGQPLAAMVAASFGVPVIALLSSPGATGGSYGAATTLDTPTVKGFEAEQDIWSTFFEEILRDIDPENDDMHVSFPSIEQDPGYRKMSSATAAYAGGAIFQDEFREVALDILDQPDRHPGEVPEPDEFNAGSDPADDSNIAPSQGNSGAVPGGFDQDDTNHEGDESL